MTIASPTVVTRAAHGLANGQRVLFTTTGALPTGIGAGQLFYVRNATANTFQLSTTISGALVNATGSQSGTHTVWSADFAELGQTGGAANHTLITAEIAAHTHTETPNPWINSGPWAIRGDLATHSMNVPSAPVSGSTGGDRPHLNLQPYIVLNYIIKT